MAAGHRIWVVSAGFMPLDSHGAEPQFTSRDVLAVLNCGAAAAQIEITVYYEQREPVGPYRVQVEGRRQRRIRFNDLIFPEAIPLGLPFAAVIRADRRVIVQFTRLDSGAARRAWAGTIAYAE